MARQTVRTAQPKRVYVQVSASFDKTGYMQPSVITWPDSRVFTIESVKDFRPASMVGASLSGDCYTVLIKGKERHLFFERTDALFASRVGRWFVEQG